MTDQFRPEDPLRVHGLRASANPTLETDPSVGVQTDAMPRCGCDCLATGAKYRFRALALLAGLLSLTVVQISALVVTQDASKSALATLPVLVVLGVRLPDLVLRLLGAPVTVSGLARPPLEDLLTQRAPVLHSLCTSRQAKRTFSQERTT
jgi:hypothetical protein